MAHWPVQPAGPARAGHGVSGGVGPPHLAWTQTQLAQMGAIHGVKKMPCFAGCLHNRGNDNYRKKACVSYLGLFHIKWPPCFKARNPSNTNATEGYQGLMFDVMNLDQTKWAVWFPLTWSRFSRGVLCPGGAGAHLVPVTRVWSQSHPMQGPDKQNTQQADITITLASQVPALNIQQHVSHFVKPERK